MLLIYLTGLALIVLTSFTQAQLTAKKPLTCPYHCHCSNFTLTCSNGYLLDEKCIQRLPFRFQRISINNFVIDRLPFILFTSFKNLKTLKITNSRVKYVDGDAFTGLYFLQFISLENNHIIELDEVTFVDLKQLTELNLGRNLITDLPEYIFINQTQTLTTLKLNHNRLRLLKPRIFDSLTHLEYLDLSNNELLYIHPSTFNSLSLTRFINLNDNLLVTINSDLFNTTNRTVLTKLSMSRNPLVCNCGIMWLQRALLGNVGSMEFVNSSQILCVAPHIFYNVSLSQVPLRHLNCTEPEAVVEQSEGPHYFRNPVHLTCEGQGDPPPSIVWKTPMGDLLNDPYHGEWLDGNTSSTSASKKYKIYATGETIEFKVRSHMSHSVLSVSNVHLVSSGEYHCIAINPGGHTNVSTTIVMSSAIETQYTSSLIFGGCTVVGTVILGIIGCSITVCLEKCSSCQSPSLTYYDGDIVHTINQSKAVNTETASDVIDISSEDDEDSDDEDVSDSDCCSLSLTNELSSPYEINEHTALTAEEWDAYFRQFPDDFVIDGLTESPKELSSPKSNLRGSPAHRPQGKTLETLEAVRLRLKLRVEQIDVMKERLRSHVGKSSARMKDNMARQKMRMNRKMQTIKESTSHSLQSIKEKGSNYTHKLHMGVRTAMENVGAHVQSLREFCGTGDLGQTLSIATITTDIDTNEVTELRRSITMV